MTDLTFLFDVVVTRLSCPNEKFEFPEKCQVNIIFNRQSIPITSSRINVTDFNPSRRLEIVTDPERLRQNLDSAGIPIVVRYAGSTIGNGKLDIPESVLNKIDFGMNDLMHADACEIMRSDQKIGIVELLCRITIKCDELVSDTGNLRTTCADFNSAINKQDIMFLMGAADPCPLPDERCGDVLEPEEGDDQLRLDIERYRSRNTRAILPSSEQSQTDVFACAGLKKVTEVYGEMIDSVTRRIKQLEPSYSVNREPLRPCPDKEKVVTHSLYAGHSVPIPVGDIEERGIKPIRHCPVCLCPMSWLPKYACCPNCGAKPMPMLDEVSNSKVTADSIMNEVLVRPKKPLGAEDFCVNPCAPKEEECPDDIADECLASRCTCVVTKTCAHCRIRKLCEDVFAKSDAEPICQTVEPKSNEDFCVIAETDAECRPYLVRVFSELRDLYRINDDKKASELQTRCTQSLIALKSRRSIAHKSSLYGKADKAQSMGALGVADGVKKLGHKSCVLQNKSVSRRHGWNWTSSPEARMHGWRPGAIARPTSNVMKFFLDHETQKSVYSVCKKAMERNRQRERGRQPVLNVSKSNGEVLVTLRPCQPLGIEQHPIVFKIVKSDLAKALREIGRSLKEKGFAKCSCHQTLRLCTCRSEQDKRNLQRALAKECKKHHMPSCADHLVLTDTSESEMEFNFDITPPAGTKKPLKRSKSRTTNRGTQTNKNERKCKSLYPIKPSPYYRAFDCALGDCFMGTAFGDLGEKVFEDGVFGYRGGGQHGLPVPPRNPKIWGPKAGAPLRFNDKTKSFAGEAWKDLSPKIISKMRKQLKSKQ